MYRFLLAVAHYLTLFVCSRFSQDHRDGVSEPVKGEASTDLFFILHLMRSLRQEARKPLSVDGWPFELAQSVMASWRAQH
jgi:hypothetical protein